MKRAVVVAGLVVLGIFFKSQITSNKSQPMIQIPISKSNTVPTVALTPTPKFTKTSPPAPLLISGEGGNRLIIHEVPFTVQAPTGEWGDSTFQDGCEEASVLMVECKMNNLKCTIKDGIIDPIWAKSEIEKMAEWQREKYGSAVDTSAADTGKRLLGEYFGVYDLPAGRQVYDLKNSEEIINLLRNNILITPMNGQLLGNPYYTAPGPERHMVVVVGYDPKTDEVITNDGGTRRGQGYRYKRSVFWKAIRDYPTGDHEPITSGDKRAIVIESGL